MRRWMVLTLAGLTALVSLGAGAMPSFGPGESAVMTVEAAVRDEPAEHGPQAPASCERVGAAWLCGVDDSTLNAARNSQETQAAYRERLAAIEAAKRVKYETAKATAPTGGPVAARLAPLRNSEVEAVLARAGVPAEWRPEFEAIAWCESRWRADAVGDGGNSVGMFQVWTGWFRAAGENLDHWSDPVVNARVAKYVREVRGHFGGRGGWSCADHLGIP